jgi:hypothetical protein
MKRMTMLMALLGLATILSSCIAAKTTTPYQPVPAITGQWLISTTFLGETSPSTFQMNLVTTDCNGVGVYIPDGGTSPVTNGTTNPIVSCSVASNILNQQNGSSNLAVTAVSGNFTFPPQNFVVVTQVYNRAPYTKTLQWFFLVECADAACNGVENQYIGGIGSYTPTTSSFSSSFSCDQPDALVLDMPCAAYGGAYFPFTATSN